MEMIFSSLAGPEDGIGFALASKYTYDCFLSFLEQRKIGKKLSKLLPIEKALHGQPFDALDERGHLPRIRLLPCLQTDRLRACKLCLNLHPIEWLSTQSVPLFSVSNPCSVLITNKTLGPWKLGLLNCNPVISPRIGVTCLILVTRWSKSDLVSALPSTKRYIFTVAYPKMPDRGIPR